MPEPRRVSFDQLDEADLVVDAVYEGGTKGNAGDDPLHRLLRCGIGGGFRPRLKITGPGYQLVVIYSDLSDNDWPDVLDSELGRFTYYGDNKHPGRELHQTKRKGNRLLAAVFEDVHSGERFQVPPFFVFTKGLRGRDVVFRGLAVPGASGLPPTDDLVAVWRSDSGQRFQNYRAVFTVLDVGVISRAWINELLSDELASPNAPSPWVQFQRNGLYKALRAPKTRPRPKADQLPMANDRQMVEAILSWFKSRPHAFEACAARIWQLHAQRVDYVTTRPSRDGGRDAYGNLYVGPESDPIKMDFVLEAKLYDTRNAVGVRELARLISRIRNRMFGVLVTTSYLHEQAYQELRSDGHPIIVISGRDIVDILRSHGVGDVGAVNEWLAREFEQEAMPEPMAPPYELSPVP